MDPHSAEEQAAAADLSELQAPPPAAPSLREARRLLHRTMRVRVLDGRLFVGTFHCLDKQGNIILRETLETRPRPRSEERRAGGGAPQPPDSPPPPRPRDPSERALGMVLIPAACRVSCEVECGVEETLMQLKLDDAPS